MNLLAPTNFLMVKLPKFYALETSSASPLHSSYTCPNSTADYGVSTDLNHQTFGEKMTGGGGREVYYTKTRKTSRWNSTEYRILLLLLSLLVPLHVCIWFFRFPVEIMTWVKSRGQWWYNSVEITWRNIRRNIAWKQHNTRDQIAQIRIILRRCHCVDYIVSSERMVAWCLIEKGLERNNHHLIES
jgi:hypothetical protein